MTYFGDIACYFWTILLNYKKKEIQILVTKPLVSSSKDQFCQSLFRAWPCNLPQPFPSDPNYALSHLPSKSIPLPEIKKNLGYGKHTQKVSISGFVFITKVHRPNENS